MQNRVLCLSWIYKCIVILIKVTVSKVTKTCPIILEKNEDILNLYKNG